MIADFMMADVEMNFNERALECVIHQSGFDIKIIVIDRERVYFVSVFYVVEFVL